VKLETIVKESDFVATVNRYLGIKGEVRLQIIDDSNRKFSSLGALIRFDDHIEYER
jgi:hypothetical protein